MHEESTLQPGDVVALTEDLRYAGGIPAGTEGVVTRVFTAVGTLYAIDFEGYAPVTLRPSLVRFVERPPDLRRLWDLSAHVSRVLLEDHGILLGVTQVRVNRNANGPSSAA